MKGRLSCFPQGQRKAQGWFVQCCCGSLEQTDHRVNGPSGSVGEGRVPVTGLIDAPGESQGAQEAEGSQTGSALLPALCLRVSSPRWPEYPYHCPQSCRLPVSLELASWLLFSFPSNSLPEAACGLARGRWDPEGPWLEMCSSFSAPGSLLITACSCALRPAPGMLLSVLPRCSVFTSMWGPCS